MQPFTKLTAIAAPLPMMNVDTDQIIPAKWLKTIQRTGLGTALFESLRYREAMIEVGETVAVLGSGVREPDPNAPPEAAYRGAPPTPLRLTSSPRFPLIISDDPSTTRDA